MKRGPVVITGFMGCGKTEVARSLARRLNLRMTDLDELITKTSGRTPGELIQQDGERTFRQIESTTLDKLLNERSAEVIALGGGAWIEDSNRMALQHAHAITVWLDTPLDMCWNRIVASSEDRPLGRTKEQATQLYELRYPVYALAQIRVAVSEEASPEGLAAYIETEIRKLGLEE